MLPVVNTETVIFFLIGVSKFLPYDTNFFTHRIKLQDLMFTATRTFTSIANFFTSGRIFTLRAPVYTVITEVLPHADQAMVTNNYTVLTEV